MERLMKKFRECIDTFGILNAMSELKRVIVAFSGGADSTLLLHLAVKYFENTGVTVEAAHLNHMIRGDEADRDEAFCVETAEKLGVKLHLRRVDIPSLVENGSGGVEEVARRERYAFFDELIKAGEGKTLVATAHNADDNLETVLFNMARGTALRGLCGIPPIRDGKFIRPMLVFTGDEIRSACAGHDIRYVNDSTNFETEYTRNYIRAEVVPALEKLSPMLSAHAMKMCASLRRDEDFICAESNRFLDGEDLLLGVENFKLTALHDAVLSRVISAMFEAVVTGTGAKLESVHINSIITAIRDKEIPFSITVPGGVNFTSDGRRSRFVSSLDEDASDIDKSEIELPFDSVITKNGYNILLSRNIEEIKQYTKENIYNLSIYQAINFDKIKDSLKIRTRVSGDIYRFGGMTRKVKKLFSERHLSSTERETLPLFTDDDGIVWIPGFPLRDALKCDNSCDIVYCLVFK